MTTYIGTSATAPLGDGAFYRLTIDDRRALGGVLPVYFDHVFDGFYDSMSSSTGVFFPVSPNPTKPGDRVAVVDVKVRDRAAAAVTVVDAVRRVEEAGRQTLRVRSIQHLPSFDLVRQGVDTRQQLTDYTNRQREQSNPFAQLANTVGGIAQYLLFGALAFAAIRFSKDLK